MWEFPHRQKLRTFFKKNYKKMKIVKNRQKVKKSKGSTLYFFINFRKFFCGMCGNVCPFHKYKYLSFNIQDTYNACSYHLQSTHIPPSLGISFVSVLFVRFPSKVLFLLSFILFLLLFPCLVPPIFLFLSRSRALYR